MKSTLHLAGQGLLIAGLLFLSYPVMSWVYAEGFQAYQHWVFDRDKTGLSEADGPSSPLPHSVIGRIEIPTLDLSVMVLEGAEERDLRLGAGHLPGTALPGEAGNVAIGGHRDTFFRSLRNIRKNDVILLTSRQGSYRYVVETTEIADPTDTQVLQRGADPVLTLITCYPFSFVGPAPDRFVVRARRISRSNS